MAKVNYRSPGMRFAVSAIILLLLVAIITVLYLIIKPGTTKLLTREAWCIDKIYYKGQLLGPKTRNAIYIKYGNGNTPCIESAIFRDNGDLNLPGLNTRQIDGMWKLAGDSLKIEADTLQKILTGTYRITVDPNKLELRSVCTEIYGHKDKTAMPKLF